MVLLIPVVASSALPVIVFLVIRARLWAVVSTISNPLSAHGWLAGVGTGFGLGLMNLCWRPDLAAGGALAGVVGDSPVFALLALTGIVIGIAVLRMHLRPCTTLYP